MFAGWLFESSEKDENDEGLREPIQSTWAVLQWNCQNSHSYSDSSLVDWDENIFALMKTFRSFVVVVVFVFLSTPKELKSQLFQLLRTRTRRPSLRTSTTLSKFVICSMLKTSWKRCALEMIYRLGWMPPQSDFWWQINIQVNYSTWSTVRATWNISRKYLVTRSPSHFPCGFFLQLFTGKPTYFPSEVRDKFVSNDFFCFPATNVVMACDDDKLPSSLRATKRGDVESFWFPVNLISERHKAHISVLYISFLAVANFPFCFGCLR